MGLFRVEIGVRFGVGREPSRWSPIRGFPCLRNWWYDPQTGRFLTQDPIGLAGGVNLYSYAGNNPIAFSDPFGLCPPEWLCKLANFSAGFGDAVSFGLTDVIRDAIDANGVVDQGSGAYIGGFATGIVVDAALGNAAAAAEGSAARGATSALRPKLGAAGGPGAGKNFSKSVQRAEEAAAGGRCRYCGTETIRSKTPHPRRGNTDHAISKRNGGNNSIENANHSCQTCNLSKGSRNADEFIQGGP